MPRDSVENKTGRTLPILKVFLSYSIDKNQGRMLLNQKMTHSLQVELERVLFESSGLILEEKENRTNLVHSFDVS